MQLHGLAEIADELHDQRPVEAHVDANGGDVLRRRVRTGDHARRIAGQQMHEQEDEGADGQQHRNGAHQPPDQIVEHAGPSPAVNRATHPRSE